MSSFAEAALIPYVAPGYQGIMEALAEVDADLVIKDDAEHCIWQARVNSELLIVRESRADEETDLDSVEAFQKRIRALRTGLGMRALEQMVYYSPAAKTVVTKHAGTPLDSLSASVAGQISLGEWVDALTDLEEATEKGLCLDTGSAANVTYDRRSGLTFIDYVQVIDEELTENPHPAIEFCDFLEVTLCEVRVDKRSTMGAAWRRTGRKALRALLERYPGSSDIPSLTNKIEVLQDYLDPTQLQ